MPPQTDVCREAYDAWQRYGSKAEAARQLGIPVNTLKGRIERFNQDPAITAAQEAVGTNLKPQLVWAKTKDEDGNSFSVLLKPDNTIEAEDVLERISDRLERITPAPYIARPKETRSDLCNLLPLFDVHLSMRVGDYGTAEAVQRLQDGSSDILDRLPRAGKTIILNGGDFTHQNDSSNQTPKSKHPLPVDMEYEETTDIAVDVTASIIEKALQVSDEVVYQPLRGNHDPNTARILRSALRQRYRENKRVTVLTDNIHFFAHPFGNNLFFGYHGDVKANAQKDVVLNFAARYSKLWGAATYRELFLGHLHSILSLDIPGALVNRVRSICPMDRHSMEDLWESVSEMQGITYKANGGRYHSATHYFG